MLKYKELWPFQQTMRANKAKKESHSKCLSLLNPPKAVMTGTAIEYPNGTQYLQSRRVNPTHTLYTTISIEKSKHMAAMIPCIRIQKRLEE